MSAGLAGRAAAWLAGLWTGVMVAIGAIAAPTLFAVLPRVDAGRAAARLFEIDAYVGLAAGAVLLVQSRRVAAVARAPGASRFSTEMVLALLALFAIVAGHFAVRPMIDAARAGAGGPSFAVLHGVASAFFLVKLVAVAVLAWRLTARRPSAAPAVAARATTAAPTS